MSAEERWTIGGGYDGARHAMVVLDGPRLPPYETIEVAPASPQERVEDLSALADVLRSRLMEFGGFRRGPSGQFWISREDVLRLIDDVFVFTALNATPARTPPEASGDPETGRTPPTGTP